MSDEYNLSPDDLATVFASFLRQVAAAADWTSPLLELLREHLGADPASLPVTEEQFDSFEQPNLQVALDSYIAAEGRSARLIGVNMQNKRFMSVGLSEMASWGGSLASPAPTEGPVDRVNFHLGAGRVLACVQFGLYLIGDGDARLIALVAGPSHMGDPRRQKLRLEVMSAREEDAPAFIERVRGLMDRLNVYRGQIVSISAAPIQLGPGPVTLVQFERLPAVAREDVVLPEGVLDRIERHTITFSRHAEELVTAGRSLKRGLLLHGLPGTGKTLTVMYLAGILPGRTVILTSGRGLGMIQTVAQLARRLSPSMVVLEDVDLVAEERTMPGFGARAVLFELLNELDGLRDDQDVIFVLTTNRPDVLEPALAARPGRVDVVVELPLPDARDRRRLVELYARGLSLDDVDVAALVDRIDGATPAYVKELMRNATLLAAEAGSAASVRQEHIDGALAELGQGGRLAERLLGFRPEPPGAQARPGALPSTPTGFPAAQVFVRRDG